MGTRHQVVHPEGPRDYFDSKLLGPVELVLVVRSSCLPHNRQCNSAMNYKGGVDGLICKAVTEAVATWQQRYVLQLPTFDEFAAEPDAHVKHAPKKRVAHVKHPSKKRALASSNRRSPRLARLGTERA